MQPIHVAVFEIHWIDRFVTLPSPEVQRDFSGEENPQNGVVNAQAYLTLSLHSPRTAEEREFEINQGFMFGATGHGTNDEDEEDLTPPLLEEAVNLLLVNKTVMSCILVLQNRRDTGKNQESTTTELPTVIHLPLKV